MPIKLCSRLAELAWLAGFFDGEGWIDLALSRGNPTLHVAIKNTDLTALERCQAITGVGSIHSTKSKTKPTWTWRVCGSKAQAVLRWLRPLLTCKASQADVVVAYPIGHPGKKLPETVRSRRMALREELNHARA